ncbi:MAG: UDP-3-O-acyl-N-acetylglucosamine deacetylase [bacterium]|nr:UDP-3-O-acyl-N-acetylglucosamine deacetylase [bacterium]
MIQQRTLAEKISCTGLGLHTGAPVKLSLHPARVDAGIRFVRRHGDALCETPAHWDAVASTVNATTLGEADGRISTVEHVLAALYALGVSNALVEVDGPEIPVMDGSAASFVHLIRTAGVYDQHEPQPVLQVRRKLELEAGERKISIEPARHLEIVYRLDFAHPAIGRQEFAVDRLRPAIFEVEVSRARTFGFLADVEAMRRAGLARGGSLANTVVLDDRGVMNPGGLRYPDEFVRHKVLDLIGDLALVGFPVQGRICVERGGHSLHHRLVCELVRRTDAWNLRGGDPRRVGARSELDSTTSQHHGSAVL